MQRVYNQTKTHATHNQWLGLFNYESEEACGLNGFLRFSISVLHENDPKVALIATEQTKNKANFLMPPQLKQNMTFNQLALYFYGALNIPNMDGVGDLFSSDVTNLIQKDNKKCNAFIRVEYGEAIIETDVKDSNNNLVTWNQIIKIPIPEPRVSDKVFIKLYDKDLISNQLIGTFELNLEDVIPPYLNNLSIKKNNDFKNKYENPTKINFYGSDPSKLSNDKFSDLMNDNSEIGMMYKGTVVMKALKIDSAKPIKSTEYFIRSINEDIYKKKISWNFHLRLYKLFTFNMSHSDGKSCKVFFNIGHLFYGAEGVLYINYLIFHYLKKLKKFLVNYYRIKKYIN